MRINRQFCRKLRFLLRKSNLLNPRDSKMILPASTLGSWRLNSEDIEKQIMRVKFKNFGGKSFLLLSLSQNFAYFWPPSFKPTWHTVIFLLTVINKLLHLLNLSRRPFKCLDGCVIWFCQSISYLYNYIFFILHCVSPRRYNLRLILLQTCFNISRQPLMLK